MITLSVIAGLAALLLAVKTDNAVSGGGMPQAKPTYDVGSKESIAIQNNPGLVVNDQKKFAGDGTGVKYATPVVGVTYVNFDALKEQARVVVPPAIGGESVRGAAQPQPSPQPETQVRVRTPGMIKEGLYW